MTGRVRKIVDLRIGEPHDNAGLALKLAFVADEPADLHIAGLMIALWRLPYARP